MLLLAIEVQGSSKPPRSGRKRVTFASPIETTLGKGARWTGRGKNARQVPNHRPREEGWKPKPYRRHGRQNSAVIGHEKILKMCDSAGKLANELRKSRPSQRRVRRFSIDIEKNNKDLQKLAKMKGGDAKAQGRWLSQVADDGCKFHEENLKDVLTYMKEQNYNLIGAGKNTKAQTTRRRSVSNVNHEWDREGARPRSTISRSSSRSTEASQSTSSTYSSSRGSTL